MPGISDLAVLLEPVFEEDLPAWNRLGTLLAKARVFWYPASGLDLWPLSRVNTLSQRWSDQVVFLYNDHSSCHLAALVRHHEKLKKEKRRVVLEV